MSRVERMVIVGGGQCGARAAHALRANGWCGEITLIGSERALPYERPPLSKSVLTRQSSTAECCLYGESFYRDQCIETRVGTSVVALDRLRKTVRLDDDQTVEFSKLLLATGATPRMLRVPGCTLEGVHTLRTELDAEAISRTLVTGKRIAIIGAGFIGLEVAASAIAMGCEVLVLEAAPRALMRAVPGPVAERIVTLHRSMGVDFRFGTGIVRFVGDRAVRGVELNDGELITCDAVVVGIGVTPNTALAAEAGLDISDGIVVDAHLRTKDESIFAAGDACSFHHALFEQHMRLECWKNANDHARIAALNMLGHHETVLDVPWFWSDHYDITVQIAGVPSLGASTVIREIGQSSHIYFAISADGVLVGASGVGSLSDIAKDIRVSQELIAKQLRVSPMALMDRTVKLRSLLVAEKL
ncbi:NAD(P)/FAD-dependent oxidoreductase [Paraburkholderia tropica]|uniref:NAD(P)/FAD-dependent oxidoreductase n=1 Tax=Paraburkholderia tropica TaxID=92647 RepID=UPI002AB70CE8|nr:FAD-dependent oxidoreductase [Paraburkholderia tropica]